MALLGTTALAGLLLSGCHSLLPSHFWPAPDQAARRNSVPNQHPQPKGLGPEWAAHPRVVERALHAPLEIRAIEPVEHGQTKTARLDVYSASEDIEFQVKWKAAKPSFHGVNNSPRREIAAYQVQKLVLAPEDYVVPPTTLLCLPPKTIQGKGLGTPNLDGAKCVVGAVSLWLQNVRYPIKRIDWARFRSDSNYAYYAANLNIAGILIDHSDTHTRNMLVSSAGDRRMFLIDNGIAFNSRFRSPFSRDWNRLRVPALRKESVDRLRALRREDLIPLAVVAELREDRDGLYLPAEPSAPLGGATRRGIRVKAGVLQLGLTDREIDAVWARRNRLLELIDAGIVDTF